MRVIDAADPDQRTTVAAEGALDPAGELAGAVDVRLDDRVGVVVGDILGRVPDAGIKDRSSCLLAVCTVTEVCANRLALDCEGNLAAQAGSSEFFGHRDGVNVKRAREVDALKGYVC